MVEVFTEPDSLQLRHWLEMRRRILRGATRPRAGQAAMKRGREHIDSASIFTVFAANGRAIASSTEIFSDPESAQKTAEAVIRRADDYELRTLSGTPDPALAWLICVDGTPKVMPLRYFTTPRARNSNAAGTLTALRSGILLPLGGTTVQSRLERERLHPEYTAFVEEGALDPIKERGAPRPIRPIASREVLQQRVKVRRPRPEGEL